MKTRIVTSFKARYNSCLKSIVLVNEEKSPGNYEIKFNGTSLPSGVYFYQLTADKYIKLKKCVLLK
jgi:hypothetical protein